jgi:hypothetical protein
MAEQLQFWVINMACQKWNYCIHPDLEVLKICLAYALQTNKNLVEPVLQTLCDLVQHPEQNVRKHLASFFNLFVYVYNPSMIVKRILPQLFTLANDSDRSVRISTLSTFGTVLQHHGQTKELLDRLEIQLSSFIDDPIFSVKYELLKIYSNTAASVFPSFRDSFILPSLLRWVSIDFRGKKPRDMDEYEARLRVLVAALQFYHALSCMYISENIVSHYVLPVLQGIRREMASLDITGK